MQSWLPGSGILTEERITLGGTDISGIEPETLLRSFSIVFQDVTLFNNTIMEISVSDEKGLQMQKLWKLP